MYPSNKYDVVVFGSQTIRIWQRTHTHIHRYTSLICLKIGYQAILKAILHWHVVSIHSYRPGISVFISSPPVTLPCSKVPLASESFACNDAVNRLWGWTAAMQRLLEGHSWEPFWLRPHMQEMWYQTEDQVFCNIQDWPRQLETGGTNKLQRSSGVFFCFGLSVFLFVLPVLTFPTWLMHLKDSMGLLFSDLPQRPVILVPIGSMYAIYVNIYHQYTPNVSIYTIHGSYGVCSGA